MQSRQWYLLTATEMRIRKGLPGFEKWKTTNCEQAAAVHTLTVLH